MVTILSRQEKSTSWISIFILIYGNEIEREKWGATFLT